MNNGSSFAMGWAALGAAGIGGAILGWREANVAQKRRVEENLVHTKRRNELLAKAEEKMKLEGKIKFKDHVHNHEMNHEAITKAALMTDKTTTTNLKKKDDSADDS